MVSPARWLRARLFDLRLIFAEIVDMTNPDMPTREQLRSLAQLRLREAEMLFQSGFYDGCAYLCGYVVETAFKARICATLNVTDYPEKRLQRSFLTHSFDDLKLLAGMDDEFNAGNPSLVANWSIASKWKPARRYEPQATYNRELAEAILNAVRSDPDGVLACIAKRW